MLVQADSGPQPAAPDPSSLWKNVALSYVALRRANGAAPRMLKKLEYQIGQTIAVLGEMRVDEVTAQDVLRLVRPIAASGAVESAHEVRTRCSQVFRFAIAEGRAQMDPASFTIDAMVRRRRGEFAGITEPGEVGELVRRLQENRKTEPQIRAALLLSAYLFPRNSELRGMRWSEIDWQAALWEIPAERMKMKRAHLVPLPRQALTSDTADQSKRGAPVPLQENVRNSGERNDPSCMSWIEIARPPLFVRSVPLDACVFAPEHGPVRER